MNYLLKTWNWLSGKKTKIAMLLFFLYGGFSFVGVELEWLKQIAIYLGGVGLAHGVYKRINK